LFPNEGKINSMWWHLICIILLNHFLLGNFKWQFSMFHFFRVFNKISFKYFIRILENQTLNYKFDDHVITHKGTFSTQPSQKQLIEGNWRTFCGIINNLLPFKGEKHSFYSDKSVEFYFPFPVSFCTYFNFYFIDAQRHF
jgi:hypothetical protein